MRKKQRNIPPGDEGFGEVPHKEVLDQVSGLDAEGDEIDPHFGGEEFVVGRFDMAVAAPPGDL